MSDNDNNECKEVFAMTLPYQRELDFTIAILERMRVPVHLLHQDDPLH